MIRSFYRYDRQRFEDAIQRERREDNEGIPYFFDIVPFYYQKEILDRLQAERTIHNHYKNLIVAATGTGKTVISAFDFRSIQKDNQSPCTALIRCTSRRDSKTESSYIPGNPERSQLW